MHGHLEVVRFFLSHAKKMGKKDRFLLCPCDESSPLPLPFHCLKFEQPALLKALVESEYVDLPQLFSLVAGDSSECENFSILHNAALLKGRERNDHSYMINILMEEMGMPLDIPSLLSSRTTLIFFSRIFPTNNTHIHTNIQTDIGRTNTNSPLRQKLSKKGPISNSQTKKNLKHKRSRSQRSWKRRCDIILSWNTWGPGKSERGRPPRFELCAGMCRAVKNEVGHGRRGICLSWKGKVHVGESGDSCRPERERYTQGALISQDQKIEENLCRLCLAVFWLYIYVSVCVVLVFFPFLLLFVSARQCHDIFNGRLADAMYNTI